MHRFLVVIALALVAGISAASASTGVWTMRKNMWYRRSDHTATVVPFPGNRNRVVVFGGCVSDQSCVDSNCVCTRTTNKTTVYDPDSDTWAELADAPAPRYRHSAGVVQSKLYVFGGRNVDETIMTDVHVYDPATNTWATSVAWPNATSDSAFLVYNDTLFAIGGYDADYNSNKATWTFRPTDTVPRWKVGQVADMIEGRGDACAVVVNKKAYVFGGWDVDWCDPLKEVEMYDFATNTWTREHNMSIEGADRGCAALHDQIHIIGGEEKNANTNCSYSVPMRDVQVFDPVSLSWSIETQMPVAVFRSAAVTWNSASGQQQLLLFGGQGAYNASTGTVALYDLVAVFTDDNPAPTTGHTFSEANKSSVAIGAITVLVALLALVL